MAEDTLYVGREMRITVAMVDPSTGAPISTADCGLTLHDPFNGTDDSQDHTYLYSANELAKQGTNTFILTFTPPHAGFWDYSATGSGGRGGAIGVFEVEDDPLYHAVP